MRQSVIRRVNAFTGSGWGHFEHLRRTVPLTPNYANMSILSITSRFDIHMSVHRKIIPNYGRQVATFLEFIYFYRRSTCFRRFLRPSSGAHSCTYIFRYCQPIVLLAATVEEMERRWLAIPEDVCTFICSWLWAEEPPEICRASVKINSRNVATC